MTKMSIAQITVGERRREDMGDISALAASIQKYGLIHAIVVDPSGRLIAGGRRLAACESLGMSWVEVRQWDELTDAELREIELEENLRRKDLTEAERSRDMVRLLETAAEIDRASVPKPCAESAHGGRFTPQPGSLRRSAERVGMPESTARAAKQHVAAVERYPELEPLPQVTAIRAAKALDAAPEESREQARERIKEEQAAGERVLSVVTELVPGARERMASASMRTSFSRGVEATGNLTMLKPPAIVAALDQQGIEQARQFITRTRRWLDDLESELGSGIRLIASESD